MNDSVLRSPDGKTSSTASCTAPATARWSVGGLLLEAIAQRDFDLMADCFEPDATMRALLPSGSAEFQGLAQIVDRFRQWFGDAEQFEVLDGTVGDVGNRLHLAWRLRMRLASQVDDHRQVIEQHAYARAHERIGALDLLCSGFVPERRL
jgi:hypothetical protein